MALILTDIDDTVLTWYREFAKWLFTTKGIKAPTSEETWALGERLGISEDHADQLVNEFNASGEFFDLKPCRKSEVYLPMLAVDHKVIGITSGSSNLMDIETTKALRAANIERYLPNVFSDLIVLPLHGDKKPYLEQYYPSYWVEDSLSNAVKGLEAGHVVYLMDVPHNKTQNSDLRKVRDWADIYDDIQNYQN